MSATNVPRVLEAQNVKVLETLNVSSLQSLIVRRCHISEWHQLKEEDEASIFLS